MPTSLGHLTAGWILTCVGSLSQAVLRLGGAWRRLHRSGELEIVALTGTLAAAGAHLHLAVADETGQTVGGHLLDGCIVRTTAELVVAADPTLAFDREPDPETGFDELVVRPRPGSWRTIRLGGVRSRSLRLARLFGTGRVRGAGQGGRIA